jgi:GTP diphosphokinase / guanosine-3',5'-bis(diphosphate) 3'-diphosphatase
MNKLSVQNLSRFTAEQQNLVQKALDYCLEAHADQLRKSGEPYAIHPVAVAQSLVEWGMDDKAVAAGLLHDVVEDTAVTNGDLQQTFGREVAELVAGVTKIGEFDQLPKTGWSGQRGAISVENIRKLLLATSQDMRVMIIKLADVMHNLQTLKWLSEENQQRFAQEALEIYAPIADRLGMGKLKADIEDLGFRYAHPEEYQHVKEQLSAYVRRSQRYLKRLQSFLSDQLGRSGVDVIDIEGRQKHLYSVYKKLSKAEGDIGKIYDLIAVRIIVPSEEDCYKALGIIHQHFKPLIYRIKDYIAVPKPNGYRSLHTTVFALEGRITEIQIRTPTMHQEAEHGLAAHFFYDSQKTNKNYKRGGVQALPAKYTWVSSLRDLQASTVNNNEFVEALKVDLFQDRIFVFSPKGDLYDLPEGSTPIDFAYAVHTMVGQSAQGARVNSRLVPLDTRLENRDVVEIITSKNATPHRDWLGFVRTPHAKNRIRAWFRNLSRDSNIASGRQMIERELKVWGYKHLEDLPHTKRKQLPEQLNQKDLEAVMQAVGEGAVSVQQVIRKLFPPQIAKTASLPKVSRAVATGRVVIANSPKLEYLLAPCCRPSYPHSIVGYVTRGSGVTVHRQGCLNLPQEQERLLECSWEMEGQEKLICCLEIIAANRIGLLRDVTGAIAGLGFNINGIVSRDRNNGEESVVEVNVEAPDLYAISRIVHHLEKLLGVLSVQRKS